MPNKIIWMREDVEAELKRISDAGKFQFKPNPLKKKKKKNKQKIIPIFTTAEDFRGKVGYSRYLKTDWWIKRRADYWKTHERKCYCCGHYADNLHHNNYSRMGRESDKDFVALCHDCHTKVHEIQKETGKTKVRGLLCSNCNNGLGRFLDSPELLRIAALYLEES